MSITPQKYFDKASNHLREQGKQAFSKDFDQCLYLTSDGLKCVVGSFLPHGHEAQDAGGDVEDLALHYPELKGVAWPESDINLADQLQSIHDADKNWSEDGFNNNGERELENLANRKGLTYTKPI